MRDVKKIDEVLSISAIEHLKDILSKCDVDIDSIKLFSNQKYILDLVLLQMFGFLEKKYQDYRLYIALMNPNNRFHYYNKPHNIEFRFEDVFNSYKETYKEDNNVAKKSFICKLKPMVNEIKFMIKGVFCCFGIWNILRCEYGVFLNDDLINGKNDDDCPIDDKQAKDVYSDLTKMFEIAYSYRNTIAHNIDFEYKTNTRDFDLLKDKPRYCLMLYYFFVIVFVDEVLNDLIRHYRVCNLLDF